jgi:site-specific recombinase XerD
VGARAKVLTKAEVGQVLETLSGKHQFGQVLETLSGKHQSMAQLLYGSGLRLMECVRLRVQDLDFGHQQILVRNGKGHKDRVTMLPQTVQQPFKRHLVLALLFKHLGISLS